jgi:hypothetical protein
MHMGWALVAMKLVAGLPGGGPTHVDPKTGDAYVGVVTPSHYEKVQVAVYADRYTCQVWAQRIAHLSETGLGSAECLAQQMD